MDPWADGMYANERSGARIFYAQLNMQMFIAVIQNIFQAGQAITQQT